MDVSRYLERITYSGSTEPTLEVLRAVHRAHACGITYENLDVVRQVPVSAHPEAIYPKIVEGGRGGWCYEMNGLLGWALTELGFCVHRLVGGVMRQQTGDDALGNHLVLRVDLGDGQWIADVGLGNGIVEPLPLREGEHSDGSRHFRLEHLGGEEWRFHNLPGQIPSDFDFLATPATEGLYPWSAEDRLLEVGQRLQRDPESIFRQTLICQRMKPGGPVALLGRVLRSGDDRQLVGSVDELHGILREVFELDPPPLEGVWPHVVARHEEMFGDTPLDEIRFGPPPSSDDESG